MQNFQWEMMAQFIFPAHFGIVEEVISVDIKPRWQEVETGDSIRLTGIYHMMAVVRFNPSQTPRFSEGTFIEHIELDGNNGYFEYALPFEVDLPREKIKPTDHPRIDIRDLSFFVFDGSNCLFKWDARCIVGEQTDESELEQTSENERVNEQERTQHTSTELLEQNDTKQSVEVQSEVASIEQLPHEEVQTDVTAAIRSDIQLEDAFEKETYLSEQDDALNYLESIHLPTYGDLVELQETVSEEQVNTELQQQERIVEAHPVNEQENQQVIIVESEQEDVENTSYLPSDTDDFYNQLTESYTVLKLSNDIIRE